jgi:two-component system phosphate regulon response regulator PhoB
MAHPDRAHARAASRQAWGDHVFVEERTLDVHIRRLRQALELPGHKDVIETERGIGYCSRSSLP